MPSEEIVFRHTPDMGEISGFGGDYEKACQDMLEAGARWLHSRLDHAADIVVSDNPQVFGILSADSADAEALSKVVVSAADGCSGAMHHAVMLRLNFIAKNGWEAYCAELRADERGQTNGRGD